MISVLGFRDYVLCDIRVQEVADYLTVRCDCSFVLGLTGGSGTELDHQVQRGNGLLHHEEVK